MVITEIFPLYELSTMLEIKYFDEKPLRLCKILQKFIAGTWIEFGEHWEYDFYLLSCPFPLPHYVEYSWLHIHVSTYTRYCFLAQS